MTLYKNLVNTIKITPGLETHAATLIEDIAKATLKTKLFPSTAHTSIVQLLDFYLDTGNEALCTSLLWPLISPEALSPTTIQLIMMPLLRSLSELLRRRKISPTTPPFSAVFKNVMLAWAATVLGPSPASRMAITPSAGDQCSCNGCREVLSWLQSPNSGPTLQLRLLPTIRYQHLAKQLPFIHPGYLQWTPIPGRLPGLKVRLPESVTTGYTSDLIPASPDIKARRRSAHSYMGEDSNRRNGHSQRNQYRLRHLKDHLRA